MTSLDTRHLDLRIVPVEQLFLHEETDPDRVDRLRTSMERDGILRNPPIVAEVPGSSPVRYVVLDGATRTTATRAIGCHDILVQVVPYDMTVIRLEAWYHLLRDNAARTVLDRLRHLDGAVVSMTTVAEAEAALAANEAAAAIMETPERTHLLTKAGADTSVPHILRQLVRLYGGFGEIHRIVNDDLQATIRRAEGCPAIVLFPAWREADILRAAAEGDLLPAGITRHVIPGRALNVNISLDMLDIAAPIEEKNAWLQRWLTAKVTGKKARYYHEPVFVFDD